MESRKHQQQHPPPWSGSAGGGGGGGGRSKSGHNASVSMTQSRFVEGSMNDRVSAAPPPVFLGPNELAAYERQFYTPTTTNAPGGIGGPPKTRASFQHYPPRANREFYSRRPLSSSGPSHRSSQPQLQTQPPSPQQDNSRPQLQTRKSGFLAAVWDGVREKVNLSKSKSSSSIGRVFSKDNKTPAPPAEPATVRGPSMDIQERQAAMMPPPPVDPTVYPTKEEVMESYKNLVASGFFQAHAIQGTRHPLRQANHNHGNSAEGGGPPVPPHGGPLGSLKSFSEHMAYANSQNQRMSGSGLPSIPSGTAVQSGGGGGAVDRVPPPPPTRPPPVPGSTGMRSPQQQSDHDIPSPQRGTKRGMPVDFKEIEASTVSGGARKLVKKLRRSTSRASVNFATGGSFNSHSTAANKPRPSTSSAVAPSINMSPRPSMSSYTYNNTAATPFPDPSSSAAAAAALSNAQNPFYVTAESFAPPPGAPPPPMVGTRTPPPKRKSKLIKLSSAGKESTGRRIIGTLGFGGLRRVPSSPSKPNKQEARPHQFFQLDQAPSLPPGGIREIQSSPVLAPATTLLPPAPILDGHGGRKSFGDTTDDTGEDYDSDAMVIDSPPPVVFQAAVARAVVAPAPSAFHYPQRQRLLHSRPLTSSGPGLRDSSRGAVSPPSHPPAVNHHYSLPATTTSRTPTAIGNGNGNGNVNGHHRRYPSSSPIRKKPVASSSPASGSVRVLSPPPRIISKPDNTTPTKKISSSSTKPMSPSSGNVPSARDSGLGHGNVYIHGQSYDYTVCEEMMDRDLVGGGDDDEDMENCPPTGPTAAAGAGYVW
ncbi:hypothetical protein V8F06_005825 [Rhypophila decipiens]